MSSQNMPRPASRLYAVLITWFESQVRAGTLRPGDRLPPERKLVAEFGISRTAVREALRTLAARGLVESHVGRGTYVRVPDVAHLTDKVEMLHLGAAAQAEEAFVHLVAALAQMAALRHTDASMQALQGSIHAGHEVFVGHLAEAAQNPVLGTLAKAMARLCTTRPSGQLSHLDVARVVACVAARDAEQAWKLVLASYPPNRPA